VGDEEVQGPQRGGADAAGGGELLEQPADLRRGRLDVALVDVGQALGIAAPGRA